MSTSHAGDALPTARPSTGGASSSYLHSESSAARCCVFRKKNQKLLKAKTQAQSENTQLRNTVDFKFSARSPDSHVSKPAANTARQTALTTGMYRGSSVFYLRFLQWRIKRVSFLVYAVFDGIQGSIRRAHRIIDSHTDTLNCRVNTMRLNKVRGDDSDKALERLNAKKDALKRDSELCMELLNIVRDEYYNRIRRQTEPLDSKLAPFSQELEPLRKLLDVKIASYAQAINEQMECLTSRYSSFCTMFNDDFRVVDIL